MQCQNCQHWNEAGARFCEECGAELTPNQDIAHQVSVRSVSPAAAPPDLPDLPEIPQQDLVPVSAPAAPYQGPHLLLNNTGSIFKLGAATVMGREDATLQIDFDGYPNGKYISHRHAQIVKINDKYYVEDLGSANFTYVNEIKLVQGQSEPLEEGDVLRLGKIELTFHES